MVKVKSLILLNIFSKINHYFKNNILFSGKSYSGGNPYHPRETPEWQKPITCFLNQNFLKESTDVSEIQVYKRNILCNLMNVFLNNKTLNNTLLI